MVPGPSSRLQSPKRDHRTHIQTQSLSHKDTTVSLPTTASSIMLRSRRFLFLVVTSSVLLLSPCRAQVQQSIRFNSTMTLSPVAATAADFGSDASAIAAFEALTWATFEAGIMDSPNENPLLLVPPEITSLMIVEVKDVTEGEELGITFETVMNVISETGLSEENLLLDIKFSSYWYGDTSRLLSYFADLATQAPTVFGTVGNMAIDFDQAETFDPPTTTSLPVASPSAPFVSPPTAPVSEPISSPSITLTLPPIFPPSIAASLTMPPTSDDSAEGIEQFIRVNGTMELSGVALNSTDIFLSDPATVEAYENLTQQTFQSAISDPSSTTISLFTRTPQIVSLVVVDVIAQSTNSMAITFATTLSVYADTFLTDLDILTYVRFGQYWADPNRSFAYLFDLQDIFPSLFYTEGFFQIGFDRAQVVFVNAENSSQPSSSSSSSEAPSSIFVDSSTLAPSVVVYQPAPTAAPTVTPTEVPTITSLTTTTPEPTREVVDGSNAQLTSSGDFSGPKMAGIFATHGMTGFWGVLALLALL